MAVTSRPLDELLPTGREQQVDADIASTVSAVGAHASPARTGEL